MKILRQISYKAAKIALMLWIVLSFLFILFHSLPGDFSDVLTYSGASAESVSALEQKWGLNDPMHVQYISYISNFVQGDFGTSFTHRQPVLDVVKGKMFNTILLTLPPITLGYILGSITGTIIGTNRGSLIEKYGVIPLFVIGTIPSFFLAVVMILIFSVWLNIFPTSGMVSASIGSSSEGLSTYLSLDFLWHYILPFAVIFLRYSFIPTMVMRTSVVETMGKDFIYYQKVVGLPKNKRMKNIMKHSILPVLTMFPLSMTRAIGGVVLIETVFNWPGLGVELVNAVTSRDYPVIQFVFFFIAAVVIILNSVVDVGYNYIDPRISDKN